MRETYLSLIEACFEINLLLKGVMMNITYQKKVSLFILIVMLAILPSCQTSDFQETELDRGVLDRSLTVYACEEAHAHYYVETALVKTEDEASVLVQRCERFFSSLQERTGMNAGGKANGIRCL